MISTFNDLRFRSKLVLGFGLLLVLFLALLTLVYTNVNAMIESSKWVNHTYEVIRVAKGVQADMIDMETGQRGFMVTGEDEYLEPYKNSISVIASHVAKGQELTSDNPCGCLKRKNGARFVTWKRLMRKMHFIRSIGRAVLGMIKMTFML